MSPPRAFLLDMVALFVLGAIGIVMALGIRQIEMRLLRWRPEYQKR
jgi:ABC-type nitrate/sulfonate/bicarbonate transport system permease component